MRDGVSAPFRVEAGPATDQKEELEMATVRDPVCGMDIDPDSASGTEEFDGTNYYFCSSACLERFSEGESGGGSGGCPTGAKPRS